MLYQLSYAPKARLVNALLRCHGGGIRDRTVDPLLAKQMLYQLSYTPSMSNLLGGADGDRTRDPLHAMQVLVPAELQPHLVSLSSVHDGDRTRDPLHAMQVLVPAELQPRVVLKTVLIIRMDFALSTTTHQNLSPSKCDLAYKTPQTLINTSFLHLPKTSIFLLWPYSPITPSP